MIDNKELDVVSLGEVLLDICLQKKKFSILFRVDLIGGFINV